MKKPLTQLWAMFYADDIAIAVANSMIPLELLPDNLPIEEYAFTVHNSGVFHVISFRLIHNVTPLHTLL
jgi:hypothetical protein